MQNLLFILFCNNEFQTSFPDVDALAMWSLMCLILMRTAMAFQSLLPDVLGIACQSQAKIWWDIIHDAPSQVKQVLLFASI